MLDFMHTHKFSDVGQGTMEFSKLHPLHSVELHTRDTGIRAMHTGTVGMASVGTHIITTSQKRATGH